MTFLSGDTAGTRDLQEACRGWGGSKGRAIDNSVSVTDNYD